jgi:WYL_2, Sm-like SH3 beta-barrel fold
MNMLHNGIMNVKFTKVDGSERVMKCTLAEALIPQVKAPVSEDKEVKERKVNDNNISVWDVEKEGWRSFRLDSVLEIYK